MNIIVRDGVADDAEGLAHVIVSATRNAFVGLVPDFCLSWLTENERRAYHEQALADGDNLGEVLAIADEARSARNWRNSLMQGLDPGEFLLAAEDDGAVVGYAIGRPCADDSVYRGELTHLYVLPSHQRQGVGRLLLQETARRLAAQGIHSLRVGVLRVNPNRPFYERLGGEFLYDREFDWDGVVLSECVYGWMDTRGLLAGGVTANFPSSLK